MRKAAGILLTVGCVGLLGTSAHAQTLGGMSAAAGMSASLSGVGMGIAGNLAMQKARQAGTPGAGGAGDDAMAGGGAPGGNPSMPNPNTSTNGAQSGPPPLPPPSPYNRNITGENVIANLLRSSKLAGRPIPTRKNRSSTQRSRYSRRVNRSTPAQRTQNVLQKYQKPPVGWLSYYLKDDRYKVASSVWNYVTIEDDQGRYPVKYYYRPSSPRMLALLSRSPKNIRRANRVIGFRTWQDAMIAGYQPDPISQPAPASQIVKLARLTRGPMLARYVEYVYAGQITPTSFDANYRYFQSVAQTVNADRRTRPLLSKAVNLAVGAAIGQNAPPGSITIKSRYVQRTKTVQSSTTAPGLPAAPGMAGGPGMPGAGGSGMMPPGAPPRP